MQKELIEKLRLHLSKNAINFLLINTSDEFLLEYNKLESCSRYLVTGFKGSCGEALLSQNDLFLFVDGRYHIQAEQECDEKVISVIKMKSGETFAGSIAKKISPYSKIGIIQKTTSLSFYKKLKEFLAKKNVEFVFLDNDPVIELAQINKDSTIEKLFSVPTKICGQNFEQKHAEIKNFLKENEICLFTKLEDVAYYTNLRANYIPNSSCFKGYLIAGHSEYTLYTDDLLPNFVEIPTKKLMNFLDDLKNLSQKYKILYEPFGLNLSIYKTIKNNAREISLLGGTNPYNKKSIKNSFEIEHYKEIYKKTDEVVEFVGDLVNSDKIFSEYELAQIVEDEFKKRGAIDLSFKTILAFGKNTALIHYTQNSIEKNIEDGMFVLLDCGAYFEGGYATDITRTFFRGVPTNEQKKLYTAVLKAFLQGYSYKLTSKTTGANLDTIVRKVINENQFDGFAFPHSTGHGVGICVHEAPPYIASVKVAEFPLQKGMIFSIEPGLYKEGCGGVRLENIVFINNNNDIESLSKACFEEKLIDYSMLDKKELELLNKWQKR